MKARNPAPPSVSGHGADEKSSIANGNLVEAGQTRKEFAGTIGVSTRTIARYIRDGKLIVTRTPGGHPRIHGVRQ